LKEYVQKQYFTDSNPAKVQPCRSKNGAEILRENNPFGDQVSYYLCTMQDVMSIEKPSETTTCWVQLYSDSLYSWALYKTSNKEDAEDLVQETFLIAVKSFDKFKGDSNPKTWLLAILNNKINDYYRKSYRTPVVNSDAIFDILFDDHERWQKDQMPEQWTGDTENLLDDAAFQQELQECLKRLPSNWFSAIQLKFIQKMNGNKICQELGITDTNLWQILHRAKLQMRKCLELNWFKK
jgi:RNA polymerase sigma-70 factor (ECF subfamily)